MKRTATMQALDEYAKKLTKKQVTMVYEQKMSKKYSKKIYEAADDFVEYEFYLDSYLIADLGMTMEEVIEEVRAELGNEIRISESTTGLNFKTSDSGLYDELLVLLEDMGVEPGTISDLVDRRYLNDTDY